MTLQRYKNELILLATILFALFAFFYKLSANTDVQENKNRIQREVAEVKSIVNLKKMWNNKKTTNKVKTLKSIVSSTKVKSFSKKSKKLTASYINLTSKELNKVTNKLINMPVQIIALNVSKNATNQYNMEFTCKW